MHRVWTSFKSHPYLTSVIGYTTLFATADLIQQSMLGRNVGNPELHSGDTSCSQEVQPFERRPAGGENVMLDMRMKYKIGSTELIDKWVESQGPGRGRDEGGNVGKEGLSLHNILSSSEMSSRSCCGVDWIQTARVALVGFCFHANLNYNWLKALEWILPGGGIKRVCGKVVMDQLIAAPVTISAFYIGLSALERREDLFEDWREKFFTSYKTGVVYWSVMQAVKFSLLPPAARTVFAGTISLGWTVKE